MSREHLAVPAAGTRTVAACGRVPPWAAARTNVREDVTCRWCLRLMADDGNETEEAARDHA